MENEIIPQEDYLAKIAKAKEAMEQGLIDEGEFKLIKEKIINSL